MASAGNYTAGKAVVDGFDVLRLADSARGVEVSIAPAIGNIAYEYKVNGANFLWAPYPLNRLPAAPAFFGNPFMEPWANRLGAAAFHANGRKYLLNPGLGNTVHDEGGLPMHGLLVNSDQWKVTALEADGKRASATCRLEFWRHPGLMAQFPFAHTIDMTHRLKDGVLEVETLLENHSRDPMPVSLGYHPFFQIHDAPRDSWKVHIPAREEMPLSAAYFPTGEMRPLQLADPAPLAGMESVYVLPDLVRGPDGRAEFWVEGKNERITITQGPKYPVSVIYAPKGQNFICFEPMAATINAMNPGKNGLLPPVQSIAPGGKWQESFWIRFSSNQNNPK
jgi:aldose 1-epimerase